MACARPASTLSRAHSSAGSVLHAGLDRILDVFHLVDFDIDRPIADLVDPADIDRLDDVAGFRVDRDRAAGTLPGHPLGGRDQRLAVRLAAGLFERFINQVHAVVAADRELADETATASIASPTRVFRIAGFPALREPHGVRAASFHPFPRALKRWFSSS